jgi:hypothetical protein
MGGNRMVATVVTVAEVADLDRSLTLYRDGFGVELRPGGSSGDARRARP